MAGRSTATATQSPPTRFDVLLYHNAVPVARCQGEWAGTDGLWVAGGPIRYPRNTRIDVEILSEGTARKGRMAGVVLGASGCGFKLSLDATAGQ